MVRSLLSAGCIGGAAGRTAAGRSAAGRSIRRLYWWTTSRLLAVAPSLCMYRTYKFAVSCSSLRKSTALNTGEGSWLDQRMIGRLGEGVNAIPAAGVSHILHCQLHHRNDRGWQVSTTRFVNRAITKHCSSHMRLHTNSKFRILFEKKVYFNVVTKDAQHIPAALHLVMPNPRRL